jgi:hypothetical protein
MRGVENFILSSYPSRKGCQSNILDQSGQSASAPTDRDTRSL